MDKTGTLTEDRVAYAHSIDLAGRPDGEAAEYAHLAVHFQADARDRLGEAIVPQFTSEDGALVAEALFTKVGEIGFDHTRHHATVVVRRGTGEHLLITKGDPDEILPRCGHARRDGAVVELDDDLRRDTTELVRGYAEHGMRILTVAARKLPSVSAATA